MVIVASERKISTEDGERFVGKGFSKLWMSMLETKKYVFVCELRIRKQAIDFKTTCLVRSRVFN